MINSYIRAVFTVKKIGFLLGPIICLIICLLENSTLYFTLGAASWMVIWWITEAVSISITALLPLVLFPLFGVHDFSIVAASYGHRIIFLFMGGFIIALGMEKWNLHQRIALRIIGLTGSSARGILIGFMLATGLISMWISNTATAVMMLPIALSVNDIVRKANEGNSSVKVFSLALFLGIAYAANIGGIATIIGTPPNAVLASILSDQLGIELTFSRFMLVGVPAATIMMLIAYFILSRGLGNSVEFVDIQPIIREKKSALGKMSSEEKKVLVIFSITAFLWVFRNPINAMVGQKLLNDYIVSMAGGVAMLTVPSSFKEGKQLLLWEDMKRLPWGILILFGGGLALAKALEVSGVIEQISLFVSNSGVEEISFIMLILIAISLFLTEVMSNVALTTIFLPVVIGISTGLGANSLYFAIPATLAASFAFMLPVSTPPNAIVFSSGMITVPQMMRKGVLLNVLGIILLWLLGLFVLPLIY